MAPRAVTPKKPLVLVLAGPTGSGKTGVALHLAKRLKGEIVNCDAMQVYRGMEIGTAKPTRTERRKIRHHLVDVLSPRQRMDAARFAKMGRKAIEAIIRRGKIPVLVGGSGLYLRTLFEGIFPGAPADEALRKTLYERIEKEGPEILHERLKKIDPAAARRIHPHDGRRIVRALEVYQKTGVPISRLQKEREGIGGIYQVLWFGLLLERSELYQRINARVDRMFEEGLVEEVKRLRRKGLGPTSRKAVGYAEVLLYLSGDISLERAMELVKRNSRRYAKRQFTWFRREGAIQWVPVSTKETLSQTAGKIYREVKRHA